jgi:hypothetical protein
MTYVIYLVLSSLIAAPADGSGNRQHARNENLQRGNLWDGIEVYAGLLAGLRW